METRIHLLLTSLLYLIQLAVNVSCGSQFASHVSVTTPTRSFTHGVGDPLPHYRGTHTGRGTLHAARDTRRPLISPHRHPGYPRAKPTVPFNYEETYRHQYHSFNNNAGPWPYNDREEPIRVLPASPYRVDSPDPESLWPAGLFLPPLAPRLHAQRRGQVPNETNDPYLLEGTEAVSAVARSLDHGQLYFDDIPHIQSLLENQQLRLKNNLKPHVLGSIRHTWPYYRP